MATTKREAEEYVRDCGEDEGPETKEEARVLFVAVFGCEPDADMSQFDLWSHVCSAVQS